MAQLNFSFNTPNYISEEFGGNVLLSISFPSEGYHLVMIEASNDQENWSRIQSEVISLSKEFKFIAPSKSALYRIRCKDEPESATIQETSDSSALHNGILEVVNEAITPVAKTGMAADVNLTAIAGLVATQVQAAIAELLQKIRLEFAEKQLSNMYFDKAFLSISAYTDTGIFANDIREGRKKEIVKEHSSETYALADRTKQQQWGFMQIMDRSECTLITETDEEVAAMKREESAEQDAEKTEES